MQTGPDFDKLIRPILDIYQKIEYDLLVKIATHFKLNDNAAFKNSMEWYIKKLEEQGGLTQEAFNIISKESKISKEQIKELLNEAGISTLDLETIDKVNQSRKFQINVDKLLKSELFKSILNNSYIEIDNILKLINTKALQGTEQAYMDVLNEAYIAVKTGDKDYNTAIRKALNQMANQGITVASYKQKNGKIINYSIESCVRRDVLTAVVQCTNRTSENFAKEMKAEYYEVSQHLGARVTDTHDYRDHAWWQGGIYKINGSTKEYLNFQETCNEGDVQGISGANCKHIKWAFWPGISVPKKIDIDSEENRKIYELNQMQRTYERKIRNLKKKCGVFKASGDKEKYKECQSKLKTLDKEYNQFVKINGLKRKFDREVVTSDNYNIPIFEEEYFKEFENLDKTKEHLIYYDIKTEKRIGNIVSGETNRVSPDFKTYMKIITAKKESLIAVHNHPKNTSFSFTDILTYNNSPELGAIAVRTEEYIYALSGKKIKNTSQNIEYMTKIYDEIKTQVKKENLNIIEERHKINASFAKEMGWKYGRIKNNRDD